MEAVFFSFVTFLSTLSGGFFAFKFKNSLHFIMSLTAGVLLGVIFFDIMPEIFHISITQHLDPMPAFIMVVLGFLVIHTLEKLAIINHTHEDVYMEDAHKHPTVGLISAGGLAVHSFLDGVGIGLGFHVSAAVGLLIAVAVLAHDFSDGLNTVTLMLSNKSTQKNARILLLIDATTPILGAISTLFFTIPENVLLLYLGFFAGFLLYIGASDLLPEAHTKHSSKKMIALTVLGSLFIFIVTRFV